MGGSGLTGAYHLDTALHVVVGSMATANCSLLVGDDTSTHATGSNLTRSLLLAATLTQSSTTLALICVNFVERAHRSSLLLLRVRAQHTVEILRSSTRSSALILRSLNHGALLVRQFTATARLLTVTSTTSRLRKKLISFLKSMGANRLGV